MVKRRFVCSTVVSVESTSCVNILQSQLEYISVEIIWEMFITIPSYSKFCIILDSYTGYFTAPYHDLFLTYRVTQKKSRARSYRGFLKANVWNAERFSYVLRCCLLSLLQYARCPKSGFQKIEIHSFLAIFPRLPVDIFWRTKKCWILNLLWSATFEWRTKVNHFASKNFPIQLQIHRYVEFS